jgi:hypothetical protein
VVELFFISQSPCLGFIEGELSSVEILQVQGLPVSIRRDPIPLSLDAQCLTLGGRGCLGLGRGLLGLGRVVGLDGGLMYVSGEDVRGTVVRPKAILASSSAVSL